MAIVSSFLLALIPYNFWVVFVSNSFFHQVYCFALDLLATCAISSWWSWPSATSALLLVISVLLFALCIILSPLQVFIFKLRSHDSVSQSIEEHPSGTAEETIVADVVTVHGLGANPASTWQARQRFGGEAPTQWPRDLLPNQGLKIRVLSFNHNSQWHTKSSSKSLYDHGNVLFRALRNKRQALEQQRRPLIFIGHSLGGLIIKQMLVNVSQNTTDTASKDNILQATKGIIFLGTPHRGARLTKFGKVLSLFGHWSGSSQQLLDVLEPGSALNTALHRNFMHVLNQTCRINNTVCFYETIPEELFGFTVTEFVDKSSAVIDGSIDVCSDKGHRSLQRIASANDDDYKNIVGYITGWIGAHQNAKMLVEDMTADDRDFLEACTFPEMNSRREQIDQDTCSWILQNPTYQAWYTEAGGVLEIKGNPGSGKSTVMKCIYQTLSQKSEEDHTILLNFFFSGKASPLQKSPEGMLWSFLNQLYTSAAQTRNLIREDFQHAQPAPGSQKLESIWRRSHLTKVVLSALKMVVATHRVIILVDAIDECGEDIAVELAGFFKELMTEPVRISRRLIICFSCRYYPNLPPSINPQLFVEKENREDISKYLRRVFDDAEFCGPSADQIHQDMVKRAQGIFMWIVLVSKGLLDMHRNGKGLLSLTAHISGVPVHLDMLYASQWQEDDQELQQSAKLLQWICFSFRPFTVQELRSIMDFDMQQGWTGNYPDTSITQHNNGTGSFEKQIVYLSRGLAEVREVNQRRVVQPIHQSVNDWIKRDGLKTPHLSAIADASSKSMLGVIHFTMAQHCIGALSSMALDYECMEAEEVAARISRKYSFVKYATTHWYQHAQASQAEGIDQSTLLEMWQWPQRNSIEFWARLFDAFDPFSGEKPGLGMTPLHISAMYGLPSAVTTLLQNSSINVNALDAQGRTAISWAAEHDQGAVIELLLRARGVDLDIEDDDGRTAVSYAAEYADIGVVRLLLSGKSQVSATLIENLAENSLHGRDILRILIQDESMVFNTEAVGVVISSFDEDLVTMMLKTWRSSSPIDARMIQAAKSRFTGARVVILMLINQEISFEVEAIEEIMSSCDISLVEALIQTKSDKLRIDASLLQAISRNRASREIVRLCLECRQMALSADGVSRLFLSYDEELIQVLLNERLGEVQQVIDVTEIVTTSHRNRFHGKKNMLVLLRCGGISFSEAGLKKMICVFDLEIVQEVLRQRIRGSVMNEDFLCVVAGNLVHGTAITKDLLSQFIEPLTITKTMLDVAIGNTVCGMRILDVWLQHPGTILVSNAYHKAFPPGLSRWLSRDNVTNEEVNIQMEGQAASEKYDAQRMRLSLTQRFVDQTGVTQEILLAAISNRACPVKTVKYLLKRCGNRTLVSGNVLESAAGSGFIAPDIVSLLLEGYEAPAPVTKVVMIAAVENDYRSLTTNSSGTYSHLSRGLRMYLRNIIMGRGRNQASSQTCRKLREVLEGLKCWRGSASYLQPNDAPTMEEDTRVADTINLLITYSEIRPDDLGGIVEAALTNNHHASQILGVLFERFNDQISITQRMLELAALHGSYVLETVGMLLDHSGNEMTVSKEVMLAAISNKAINGRLKRLLFDIKCKRLSLKIIGTLSENDEWDLAVDKILDIQTSNNSEAMTNMTKLVSRYTAFSCLDQDLRVAVLDNTFRSDEMLDLFRVISSQDDVMERAPGVVTAREAHYSTLSHDPYGVFDDSGPPVEGQVIDGVVTDKSEMKETQEPFQTCADPACSLTTEKLMSAAANHKKHAVTMLHDLLQSCSNPVHITAEVFEAAATNLFQARSLVSSLLESVGNPAPITEEVLRAAVTHRYDALILLDLLLDSCGDTALITERVLQAAAGAETDYAPQATSILLQHCDGPGPITEAVLQVAATNQRNAGRIMSILRESCNDSVPITELILEAAAGNKKCFEELLPTLIDACRGSVSITEEIIKAAAANSYRALEILIWSCKGSMSVTEDVLKAVATNDHPHGEKSLDLLLRNCNDPSMITDKVLMAAATNKLYGKALLPRLLEACDSLHPITGTLLQFVAQNSDHAYEILPIIYRYFDKCVDLPKKIVEAAEANSRTLYNDDREGCLTSEF